MSEIKKTETELAVTSGFVSTEGMDILREALADDCQGMDFSFDKISIPTGGVTMFQMPDEDEDGNAMAKEVTGVILYNHPAFAYYSQKYTGESVPPECSSFDGVTGSGEPGGACATCPYNQYGSGEGKSKACKNKRFLYIIREGELFPVILSLPAGSLGNFVKYTKQQLTKCRRLNQVVTKVTLKKSTNSGGIAYSQAVFTFVRELEPQEREVITSMTANVKEYAAALSSDDLIEVQNETSTLNIDPETGEVLSETQQTPND